MQKQKIVPWRDGKELVMTSTSSKPRVDWVDYAKGLCIILVVMMHSTLGVEKAAGGVSWLNGFIEWARPFRMPDFFLISGLFLSARLDRPWQSYFDSKVLHFIYFYVLWMTIQFATKGYGIYQETGAVGLVQSYLMGFIEPFGTLWFIYMLAVFFVVVKALRHVPAWIIFVAAALLEIAPIDTGHILIDEFASRFVYFFTGYWLARQVFAFATEVDRKSVAAIAAGLFVWGAANGFAVHHGWSHLPVVSLVMGFIGAGAVISMGVLLSKTGLAVALRYCGENSIVIYLAFFLFMAGSRGLLLKLAPGLDLGVMSLAVTAAGVIGPLLLFWAVRNTKVRFLFRRPQWARLATTPRGWHSVPHADIASPQAR